jgi:hypothetical protein
MANNTTALNSELLATLIGAAQYQAYETSIARSLVSVFDLPAGSGKTVSVPVYSAISASNITDESAASAADTNTTAASITLSEHVVYHRITNMLRDSAASDVFAQLGDQSGRAIAESIDAQVFAQFANFSGSATSSELTVDRILKAAATLRSRKLTGPFYAVVSPLAAYNLKKELTNAGGTIAALSGVGNQVLQSAFIGSVAGVNIIESALVATSGTDATCGVFAPSALGHAMRGTIDLQTQYQAADRATDLVLTGIAGAGTLQASHGIILVANNEL